MLAALLLAAVVAPAPPVPAAEPAAARTEPEPPPPPVTAAWRFRLDATETVHDGTRFPTDAYRVLTGRATATAGRDERGAGQITVAFGPGEVIAPRDAPLPGVDPVARKKAFYAERRVTVAAEVDPFTGEPRLGAMREGEHAAHSAVAAWVEQFLLSPLRLADPAEAGRPRPVANPAVLLGPGAEGEVTATLAGRAQTDTGPALRLAIRGSAELPIGKAVGVEQTRVQIDEGEALIDAETGDVLSSVCGGAATFKVGLLTYEGTFRLERSRGPLADDTAAGDRDEPEAAVTADDPRGYFTLTAAPGWTVKRSEVGVTLSPDDPADVEPADYSLISVSAMQPMDPLDLEAFFHGIVARFRGAEGVTVGETGEMAVGNQPGYAVAYVNDASGKPRRCFLLLTRSGRTPVTFEARIAEARHAELKADVKAIRQSLVIHDPPRPPADAEVAADARPRPDGRRGGALDDF